MAGQALLINPRRRRRKKATARRGATKRRRRRAVRRNPIMLNARRRRRRRSVGRRRVARRGRRRMHRNPRIPFVGSVNLGAISTGFAGYIGTRFGATWAMSFLPASMKVGDTAPLARVAVKAVVGLGVLPVVARMLRMKGAAGHLAIGAGIAIAEDLFNTYVAKMLPLPAGVTSLADYETGYITSYERGTLSDIGFGTDEETGAYGGGAY